jgi:hypothetical protein
VGYCQTSLAERPFDHQRKTGDIERNDSAAERGEEGAAPACAPEGGFIQVHRHGLVIFPLSPAGLCSFQISQKIFCNRAKHFL